MATFENLPLTKFGKIKKAPAFEIAQWICKAWKEVTLAVAGKGFGNAALLVLYIWFTRSEDDLLWDETYNDNDLSSSNENPDDSLSNSSSDNSSKLFCYSNIRNKFHFYGLLYAAFCNRFEKKNLKFIFKFRARLWFECSLLLRKYCTVSIFT